MGGRRKGLRRLPSRIDHFLVDHRGRRHVPRMGDVVPVAVHEIGAAEKPEDRGQSEEGAVGDAGAPGAALPENERKTEDGADERGKSETACLQAVGGLYRATGMPYLVTIE
jgi:hypothetical protein